MEDVAHFLKITKYKISKNIYIRIDPNDRSLDQAKILENIYPKVTFDHQKIPFQKIISQYSLFVCTYNATTYLETLSFNYPTLIFWNKNHF